MYGFLDPPPPDVQQGFLPLRWQEIAGSAYNEASWALTRSKSRSSAA
jgi:hypothetical protein